MNDFNDHIDDDDDDFGRDPERAPWGRYLVATLALLIVGGGALWLCLLYTSPSPRDRG